MSQASKPPRSPAEVQDAFRRLPAVEELLLDPRLNDLEPHTSRELLLEHVRAALEVWRGLIKQGKLAPEEIESKLAAGELVNAILARLARETRRGVLSAVNATGVVLHTGLGRAPVHPEAAQAMAAVAPPDS
jgi:L-seryl-tRNA(Ser) seleniumtransferase